MTAKIWFITGASRGFGRIWTEAALKRGDKVAATARSKKSLEALVKNYGQNVLSLDLDVTKPEQVKQAVARAHEHFGRLDIILNNAGYSLAGMIEEATNDEVKAMYETNIFGTLSVIRTALPFLRKQGGGHIVGVSSGLGLVTMPFLGYYSSSKWAFEAIHESLAGEIKPFNIKVTLVEPGAYATDFGSADSSRLTTAMDIYADARNAIMQRLQTMDQGDPQATPEALFKLVDAKDPPLRFIMGDKNLPRTREAYAQRLKEWEVWAPVSNSAQGQPTRRK